MIYIMCSFDYLIVEAANNINIFIVDIWVHSQLAYKLNPMSVQVHYCYAFQVSFTTAHSQVLFFVRPIFC